MGKLSPGGSRHPALFVALLPLIAYLAGSLERVPEDQTSLFESKIRGERIVSSGWHVRLRGLERLHSLSPYIHEGTFTFLTAEGSRLDASLTVRLRLSVDGGGKLLQMETGQAGTGLMRIAVAVHEIASKVLSEQAAHSKSVPRVDESKKELALTLGKYGTLEGPVGLHFPENYASSQRLSGDEALRDLRTQAQQTGVRILLVGLDGADWQIIEDLFEKGQLPNLRSLRQRGAWGNVRTLSPPLSPLLWTSVVTGTTADRHGIVDFLVRDPDTGRRVPVSSRSRKVRALWNIFTDLGRRVDVVAWWASWPAEAINGHMVSDRVAYSLFEFEAPEGELGLTHPSEYFERVRPLLVADDRIDHTVIRRFADVTPTEYRESREGSKGEQDPGSRNPLRHLAKILAATQTYHRLALDILKKGQPDLAAVYYQGIDEVSHRFMHFSPPPLDGMAPAGRRKFGGVVEHFYEYQDSLLGELMRAVHQDTVFIVVSDHGFKNGADRPRGITADIEGQPGRWHRRFGILVLAGPPIDRGEIDTASLLDVAPTILYLAGLPAPEDARGKILTQAIRSEFLARFPVKKIPTYEVTPFQLMPNVGSPVIRAVDDRLMENLRSLGYIGDPADVGLNDPLRSARLTTERVDGGKESTATVTAHINLASVHLAQGAIERAEAEISAALEIAPTFRPARQQLFYVRVKQRRYGEALRIAQDLIDERDPDDPLFLARVADTYKSARLTSEGIRSFSRAFESGRWKLGAALTRLQAEGGDLVGAERTARAVLEQDPTNEVAMGTLFRVAESQNNVERLEPLVAKALHINNRSVMHLNWLAVILERKGDALGAERVLLQAIEIDPDHGGSLANLGGLHTRRGQEKKALPVLERALRIDPENLEARVNLGSTFARLGELDEAIEQFEDAVSRGMKMPSVLNALARAYGEKGDSRTAASWLALSLEQDPNQAQIRRLLAQIRAAS